MKSDVKRQRDNKILVWLWNNKNVACDGNKLKNGNKFQKHMAWGFLNLTFFRGQSLFFLKKRKNVYRNKSIAMNSS